MTELLKFLKFNLSLNTTAYDQFLTELIKVAQSAIKREGITLVDGDSEDNNLVVMYASYLFNKRAAGDQSMPRMLRYALNNRLLSEKMRSE